MEMARREELAVGDGMSRRTFLGISAAGIATLAAAAPAAYAEEVEEEEADVVVVGGGIAGLVAAMSSKEEGAGRVVLLEKLGFVGGSGVLGSGGGMVGGSTYTPEGIDDSVERIIEQHANLQALSPRPSEYPDVDKVAYYAGETGATYDYLRDHGVRVSDVLDWGKIAGYNYANGPADFFDDLAHAAEALGVEIVLDCPVHELVLDGEAVVGVKAELDGKTVVLNAPAVILAAGGFGSNPDMLRELVPEVYEAGLINRGTVGATGECIEMAKQIGAVGFSDYWCSISAGSMCLADAIQEACDGINDLKLTRKTANRIIVDGAGQRFTSEEVPDQSAIANAMVLHGEGPWYILYANPDEELRKAFEPGVEAGAIFMADTVADLETSMGVPSGNLVATVAAYNDACASGEDEFGKTPENLVAYEDGPFYALEFYTKMIGTMGGIQTNTKLEVIDKDGAPIPGLYAVGEITNRDLYNQIYMGGASIGFYSTMGRLAGKSVNGK